MVKFFGNWGQSKPHWILGRVCVGDEERNSGGTRRGKIPKGLPKRYQKRPQNRPQLVPNRPQNGPQRVPNRVLEGGLEGPGALPGWKMLPDGPVGRPREPPGRLLSRLGAILGPKMGPSWVQKWTPSRCKIGVETAWNLGHLSEGNFSRFSGFGSHLGGQNGPKLGSKAVLKSVLCRKGVIDEKYCFS